MPQKIPRKMRAVALGLLTGVGGVSYTYKEMADMLKDHFDIEVAVGTLANWKSTKEEQMKKYSITDQYIQEVISDALAGKLKAGDEPSEPEKEEEKKVEAITRIPAFDSIADIISYVESRGYLMGSPQDIIGQLEANGLTVLKKGQLHLGPQVLSWGEFDLDFEALGKNIGANPVILFYWALYSKACENRGEDLPRLEEYVTGCVIDAMSARKWWMAAIHGSLPSALQIPKKAKKED